MWWVTLEEVWPLHTAVVAECHEGEESFVIAHRQRSRLVSEMSQDIPLPWPTLETTWSRCSGPNYTCSQSFMIQWNQTCLVTIIHEAHWCDTAYDNGWWNNTPCQQNLAEDELRGKEARVLIAHSISSMGTGQNKVWWLRGPFYEHPLQWCSFSMEWLSKCRQYTEGRCSWNEKRRIPKDIPWWAWYARQ